MTTLTSTESNNLATLLEDRKQPLREEIREGLTRLRVDGYDELLSGTSDSGDESLANLLTHITNEEVARDAAELQDVFAAEARMAAGTYAVCIDCDEPIPYARLAAYPTAKRCISCQEKREKSREPARYS